MVAFVMGVSDMGVSDMVVFDMGFSGMGHETYDIQCHRSTRIQRKWCMHGIAVKRSISTRAKRVRVRNSTLSK